MAEWKVCCVVDALELGLNPTALCTARTFYLPVKSSHLCTECSMRTK